MTINVLSCFDGMSGAQIALQRANISVNNYFASEIDKFAIEVAMSNFPQTIELGDIKNIDGLELPPIELLVGGSPCTGFSVAGKRLNFDDPRSALFFEYVRLLKECKPKYFLLENVVMKKEWQNIISEALGVQPILINSSLVSAQNRRRLYWTNIPNVIPPKDKHILLQDILEYGRFGGYRVFDKRYKQENENQRVVLVEQRTENAKKKRKENREKLGIDYCKRQDKEWVCRSDNKANCLLGSDASNILLDHGIYRKLMPIECERLQTVTTGYTASVSDNQRYKMLGNGFTIDVIAHILSFLPYSIVQEKK